MKKKLLDVAREIALDLYKAGGINAGTMRDFNAKCLPPLKDYSANQIKRIRLHNHVSQAVFAIYLNVSKSTVQQWEQGYKKPSGPALKLLNFIDRHGLAPLAA